MSYINSFKDESTQVIVIDDRSSNNIKVEAINPKIATDAQYKEIEETINKFKNFVNRTIEEKMIKMNFN